MLVNHFLLNLKWIVRDKILQAVLAVALFLIVLVPAISSFSMRQMQELSITLSLSLISLVLLVLATLLGGTAIWRDIEKRYTASVLSLPPSRALYMIGKFLAIVAFLACCAIFLGLVSAAVISYAAGQDPSNTPVQWGRFELAIFFDLCKYTLLTAVALLISSFSTSFFLPFFGTISIYLAGSASQEVFEYVSGDYGEKIGTLSLAAIKGAYYLLPNFGAFNFKLEAIYPIVLNSSGLLYTFLYFCVYTSVCLSLAIWLFSRRELP
ncbi:MAG: ABC transporter permease [Deltaproteobacteria bacterium]|nr:ABC transporter permease [Deltaproteobacteria bacterium]